MQRINQFHLLLVLIISRLDAAVEASDSECPPHWMMNEETGQCIYIGSRPSTYDTANEVCESMNTQLHPVFSVKEQSLVLSLILRQGHKCKAGDNNCKEYWISIVESKGDAQSDKVPFWDRNFRQGDRSCAVIRIQPDKKSKEGSWKVESCNNTRHYMCSTHGGSPIRPPAVPPTTTPVPTTKRHRSVPKKYHLIPKKLSWDDAFTECAEFGQMAFIITSRENDVASRYIKSLKKDTIESCVDSDSRLYGWLGGKRHTCNEPLQWMSFAGENWPVDYSNWKEGEPNCLYSAEHCLAFTQQDRQVKWKDDSCNAEHCPLCESLD